MAQQALTKIPQSPVKAAARNLRSQKTYLFAIDKEGSPPCHDINQNQSVGLGKRGENPPLSRKGQSPGSNRRKNPTAPERAGRCRMNACAEFDLSSSRGKDCPTAKCPVKITQHRRKEHTKKKSLHIAFAALLLTAGHCHAAQVTNLDDLNYWGSGPNRAGFVV
jgi:hypothetical protein